jgi:hypothetical protein
LPPGEHDERGALGGRADGAGQERGDADRARALDDELRALEQADHRVGDVVLRDRDELVDPFGDERERERAGPLDGDAVGDRGALGGLDGRAAGDALRERRAGLGLARPTIRTSGRAA